MHRFPSSSVRLTPNDTFTRLLEWVFVFVLFVSVLHLAMEWSGHALRNIGICTCIARFELYELALWGLELCFILMLEFV